MASTRNNNDNCVGEGQVSKSTSYDSFILQVVATVVTSLLHIPLIGFNFSYSAVLIGQLEECQNTEKNCSDGIYVTASDNSWIASLITIFIPIGGIIGGFMLDSFGRLTVLRLSAVPGVIGWILLATAINVPMLLLGRILNGFATAWTLGATFVYISEISNPRIRGSMVTIPSTLGAFGIALAYALGYYFHWRIIAWTTAAATMLFAVLTIFLPKSPVWLVSKGRVEHARSALGWFNKYHSQPETETTEQLDAILNLYCTKDKTNSTFTCTDKLQMFLEPTVYKPILLLIGFNIFVQFSGLYIVVFYAVSLFDEIGTNINPFIASISFGVARFITAICTIGLMQRFGRRQLMITSGLLMAATIAISGLYTKWILDGTTDQTWVPLLMLSLYVVATMLGFLAIPLAIPSELFPTSVRGMGQSIAMSILYLLAFAATYTYYDLKDALGGSFGLQFFFAVMSFGGALFTYIFLPETHKKTLYEIEDYFRNNSVYLLYKIRKSRKQQTEKNEIDVECK